jgi:hypothetical protein
MAHLPPQRGVPQVALSVESFLGCVWVCGVSFRLQKKKTVVEDSCVKISEEASRMRAAGVTLWY